MYLHSIVYVHVTSIICTVLCTLLTCWVFDLILLRPAQWRGNIVREAKVEEVKSTGSNRHKKKL